ncbi:hypothetical protein F511_42140 [Dorcoceras hygrometricum]|uniref:Uncharacterized protein n=1 Tax=Dorcoceras hygrometricum TaxID=472368 RepID=A0A2Z7BD16_9LAMI|nr:hypothetical protein F511_42140 [Dorcoceras hygrometricum]
MRPVYFVSDFGFGRICIKPFVSRCAWSSRRNCLSVESSRVKISGFPGFTAGRGFDPAGGAPGGG